MLTISLELLPLHRDAVLESIDVVHAVRPVDLDLPTPCAGWNLLDLLSHMTVQHRGFAAAAMGSGSDPATWRADAVRRSVASDPAGAYATAAHEVLDAFATNGVLDAPFALPEFGVDATFPGAMAIGFHLVDYVVHGWDVAATLGIGYDLPADVVAAVLPLALAVPDGDFRADAGSPFAPAVPPTGTGDVDRILRHLGRNPEWVNRIRR